MNWDAGAKLLERQDGGSDMYYEFDEKRAGTLAELVGAVVAMPPADAARLVIDAGAQGTFNIGDIRALAGRDDFPA